MLRSLPILMYHSVSRPNHKLRVTPELFAQQCADLKKAGWKSLCLDELEHLCVKRKSVPAKTVVFTFDDGYFDNYYYASEILEEHGFSGIIFPVASFVSEKEGVRPTMRSEGTDDSFDRLVNRCRKIVRANQKVDEIIFCSWDEIRQMHSRGVLMAAPHSMKHDRVVTSLEFKGLFHPRRTEGFFGVPPYPMPYGMPRFPLGHSLASRGYKLKPALFDLIQSLVPQDAAKAGHFLNDKDNRDKIRLKVRSLGTLGLLETEEEYEQRVCEDLDMCRQLFAEKLGTNPVSLCWPWGTYTERSVRLARRVGYKVFYTTGRGVNYPGYTTCFKRIAVRQNEVDLEGKILQASLAPREMLYDVNHIVKRFRTRKKRI